MSYVEIKFCVNKKCITVTDNIHYQNLDLFIQSYYCKES